MPLDQIEILLESPVHEVRVGAVSIMDFQARRTRTPEERREKLFDLYLRRHDRIDYWCPNTTPCESIHREAQGEDVRQVQDISNMELVGLEPTTSWVRSSSARRAETRRGVRRPTCQGQ